MSGHLITSHAKIDPRLMWGRSVPSIVKLHFPPGDQQEIGKVMFWLYELSGAGILNNIVWPRGR